jgi:Flp pilus assembly protein TadD
MQATATSVQHAVELLRDERFEEADAALSDVLERSPDDADALHFLGILRHTQGRSDEGIALIRRAIGAMPNAAGPWNNLGGSMKRLLPTKPAWPQPTAGPTRLMR